MPDHRTITCALADEAATLSLGAQFGIQLVAEMSKVSARGLVITLEGDLGAGKTTLVRGLLRGLGYREKVKSPTYTLVEEYEISGLHLCHFDFYRFTHAEEYLDAGLDEYFAGDAIRLVEWPGNAAPYLPSADIAVALDIAGTAANASRQAVIASHSDKGSICLMNFPTSFPVRAAKS